MSNLVDNPLHAAAIWRSFFERLTEAQYRDFFALPKEVTAMPTEETAAVTPEDDRGPIGYWAAVEKVNGDGGLSRSFSHGAFRAMGGSETGINGAEMLKRRPCHAELTSLLGRTVIPAGVVRTVVDQSGQIEVELSLLRGGPLNNRLWVAGYRCLRFPDHLRGRLGSVQIGGFTLAGASYPAIAPRELCLPGSNRAADRKHSYYSCRSRKDAAATFADAAAAISQFQAPSPPTAATAF